MSVSEKNLEKFWDSLEKNQRVAVLNFLEFDQIDINIDEFITLPIKNKLQLITNLSKLNQWIISKISSHPLEKMELSSSRFKSNTFIIEKRNKKNK